MRVHRWTIVPVAIAEWRAGYRGNGPIGSDLSYLITVSNVEFATLP